MANRRMFAKSIVLSDVFLDMPMSARCLYFTLGMLADDEGFIGNPKSIMRQCGATDDDMRILLAKRYVLGFESGVIVIKHWKMNNYLQNDRIQSTTYLDEKDTLEIDNKGAYTEKNTECIQNVYKMYPQYRLGKDSIDKNSIGKSTKKFTPPTLEEVKIYVEENNYNVNPQRFIDFYESKGWLIGKNKMKDWKAAVRTWNSKDPKPKQQKNINDISLEDIYNGKY